MERKKDLMNAVLFMVLVIVIGFISISYYINYKAEQRISEFNGYQAPKDSFYKDMKFSFQNVKCVGVLQHECVITNPIITLDKIKIASAKNIVLNNVEKISFNINKAFLDIKVNKLEVFNRLRHIVVPTELNNKIAKQKAKKLYKDLFPVDLTFKAAFLKTDKNKVLGKTYFSIKNNIFNVSSGSEMQKIKTKDFYTIYVDRNGSILKSPKPNIMMGEYKLPQKIYTLIPKFNYSVKDKGIFNFIYTYYVVQLTEYPFLTQKINNTFLGIKNNKLLSKKEFQSILLKRMKQFKEKDPYKISKQLTNFAISVISEKHNKVIITGKFKKGKSISTEAILLLTQKLGIPLEKVFSDYYKYNVKISK